MPINEQQLFHCRICGLKQDEKPWGDDDKTPLFEFCFCCGVEFGYEDCLITGIRKYRNNWLNNKNGEWFKSKEKPDDWSLEEQLNQIPEKYK